MRLMLLPILCFAAPTFAADDADADALLKSKLQTPLLKCEGTFTGEGVCWHAAYGIDEFLDKFAATKNTAFLDAGVAYFDALIAKMHTMPDGYKGWVGPFISKADGRMNDAHIGDSILVNPTLRFAELILKGDDEALKKKYSEKAQSYVELAKKHLIEKWDKRGTWFEDGPYGGYFSWNKYITEKEPGELKSLDGPGQSLPFNKNTDIGIACLRLFRVTGETFYREKALRIFNGAKSRMCLFNDTYVWSYWEPLGPWDIDTAKPNTLRHWVGVHPYRDYQAREVGDYVEAYQSGITFSKEDMQRIINTNLKAMWNGDKAAPKWQNSNRAIFKAALGEVPEPKLIGDYKRFAGCLWSALAPFDQTIRDLGKGKHAAPPTFDRQYAALPVTEFAFPHTPNKFLTMACVLPAAIDAKGEANVVSKSIVADKLEVALFSKDGATKVAEIFSADTPAGLDGREGIIIHKWKPEGTAPGEYRVRWTIRGEVREYPVTVK
jgi:hypothetical protein